MTNTPVGAIAHLWRFPVKSMQGERVVEASIGESGVLGDRAYALVETDTRKVVSAKSVNAYPDLLACRAQFIETPRAGDEVPPARITLPNGVAVTSDAANVNAVLSKFFGRAVTLERTAPVDFTIDEQRADLTTDAVGPATPAQLGAALFAKLGIASPVTPGAFFDAFPLSLLTTSTLNALNALRPQSRFDERRFRMNLIVDAHEPGFVENAWVRPDSPAARPDRTAHRPHRSTHCRGGPVFLNSEPRLLSGWAAAILLRTTHSPPNCRVGTLPEQRIHPGRNDEHARVRFGADVQRPQSRHHAGGVSAVVCGDVHRHTCR